MVVIKHCDPEQPEKKEFVSAYKPQVMLFYLEKSWQGLMVGT